MAESLIHIATYSSPIEADLARARLEAEGIPAVVDNGRLLVPESAAEDAHALLTEEAADAEAAYTEASGPPAPELRCPVCGTTQVVAEPGSLLVRIALLLIGQFVPLGDQSTGRRLRCEICTYRWREGEDADGRVPSIG